MMTKRILALIISLVMVLSLIAGCASNKGQTTTEKTQEENTTEKEGQAQTGTNKYKEAPMLAELVKQGKLPPVEERLPKNPRVGVIDIPKEDLKVEIGRYGGTLRLVDWDKGTTGHDASWINAKGSQGLQCPGLAHDNLTLEPDFFESFDVSSDAKTFTFTLREGIKWSDGQPITTDDIKFWYEDVLWNDKLTPSYPAHLRSGGKADANPMKLEITDKYTFKFISEIPYAGFLSCFTYNSVYPPYPSHFMKQFHEKYTSEADLNKKCKEFGFQDGEWYNLFTFAYDVNRNQHKVSLPSFGPYILKSMTDNEAILERNPYYWKVDKEGNQLPYIDYLKVQLVNDPEAATLKIINGECDLVRRGVAAANVPLYKQHADEKGYNVLLLKQHASLAEVFLNLTNNDPNWRNVVRDVRFRKAVSLAIDHERIIDAIYFGLAGPPRIIPLNEYNKDKANALLDEMRLDKKDADGFRLGPDGKRFEIPFQVATFTGEEEKTVELLRNMLKDVGLYVTTRKFENSLWLEMAAAGEIKAMTWWAHYPRWPWHESTDYRGRAWQYTYCPLWYQWFESGGKNGEEPPAEYKELISLFEKMNSEADAKKQAELWEAIKKNITDNVWWIPIIDDVINPLIVNKKLGNVPEKGYAIDIAAGPVVQMYFKE